MSKSTPILLYVCNTASFFLSHRLALALAAKQAGYEVHVAVPKAGQLLAEIEQHGFTVHALSLVRSVGSVFSELKTLKSLFSLYSTLRPDLVHHLTIKPVLYGSVVARFIKIPVVINAFPGLGHVFSENTFRYRMLRRVVILAYRFALRYQKSFAIFQNPEDRQCLIDKKVVKPEKTKLIRGSGVDLSAFSCTQLPPDPMLVILPSRMLKTKGIGEFVKAVEYIKRDNLTARFALLGEPDLGNPATVSLQQLEAWQEKAVVEWWGHCDDMPAAYAKAHIVCLPSKYGEGLPKALLEAAASGRPIITTDIPGCREICLHKKNGLLVPPGNWHALAQAIKRLLNDRQLCEEMGLTGRALVEANFSIEHVVSETLSVYRKQLA